MKRNIMVEIEEETYQELEQLAREEGTKLQEAFEQAVKTYLESRNAYKNDPFFQIGESGHSGLGDLAEAHDKYLYGSEENS